ncbi:MAG: amidohydrolase [Chloroflexi bacterium]|nr:amidohydrolase [Chloroflexota bacterium]
MAQPSIAELKARVLRAIDARREDIVGLAQAVLRDPEPGFTEVRTAQRVSRKLAELGIPHRTGIALTGIKGYLQGGAPGPTVAVLGELDSLRVPGHPFADQETGAAHACGHHAQLGMLLGIAIGLSDPEVLAALSGRVALMAVPAEEFIDVEFRYGLYREGKLGLLGGKQELIRLGEFDDVDMAMMCHTTSSLADKKLAVGGTSNGHVVKLVHYQGRAAHAGGAPWQGVNALNAAMVALNALQAQRETLRDGEHPRLHGIMTRGGSAVSSVPADVRLEWRVRGGTTEAVEDGDRKADRCFKAGALAVGAGVRIVTLAGYLPLRNDPVLMQVFRQNAERLVGKGQVAVHPAGQNAGGSTDMGDLGHLMPVVHPYAAGATGTGHGVDYLVHDYDAAVVTPAKALALTVVDLLADVAGRAREVVAGHQPALTRKGYLALQQGRIREQGYQGE